MKVKEWGAFVLLGLIWGSSFLWIKIGVADITPMVLVTLRISFGLIGVAGGDGRYSASRFRAIAARF